MSTGRYYGVSADPGPLSEDKLSEMRHFLAHYSEHNSEVWTNAHSHLAEAIVEIDRLREVIRTNWEARQQQQGAVLARRVIATWRAARKAWGDANGV